MGIETAFVLVTMYGFIGLAALNLRYAREDHQRDMITRAMQINAPSEPMAMYKPR